MFYGDVNIYYYVKLLCYFLVGMFWFVVLILMLLILVILVSKMKYLFLVNKYINWLKECEILISFCLIF